MPAVEPVTSAVFPERSIFMCHLHPKRFRAKHALGLDPGVGTGSRQENASKRKIREPKMLKVWGRRSSFNVQKVMWLIGELGLEHRHIDAGGNFGGLDTPD